LTAINDSDKVYLTKGGNMNNEILDSLRRISCSIEITMRDVIEEKYNMERDYIEIEDWELELEEIIGKGVVEGWKEINRVIEKMEK